MCGYSKTQGSESLLDHTRPQDYAARIAEGYLGLFPGHGMHESRDGRELSDQVTNKGIHMPVMPRFICRQQMNKHLIRKFAFPDHQKAPVTLVCPYAVRGNAAPRTPVPNALENGHGLGRFQKALLHIEHLVKKARNMKTQGTGFAICGIFGSDFLVGQPSAIREGIFHLVAIKGETRRRFTGLDPGFPHSGHMFEAVCNMLPLPPQLFSVRNVLPAAASA